MSPPMRSITGFSPVAGAGGSTVPPVISTVWSAVSELPALSRHSWVTS